MFFLTLFACRLVPVIGALVATVALMNEPSDTGVAAVTREIEEFVAASGWDQPPQLFALVPTAQLLEQQPDLAGRLDASSALTPIAQDEFAVPEGGDLADALAQIAWPDAVDGCAVVQEIVVLPPDAEAALTDAAAAQDADRLRQAAATHPDRTEARLVAAVGRSGQRACVLRLRSSDADSGDEIVERPDLAPNLLDALTATLD